MAECMERFLKLRKRLFTAIDEALKEDCGKSYEGSFTINIEYPNYYEDENAEKPPAYIYILLDCYIIGPHRHYSWGGKTFDEALDKCEKDINEWLEEG